MSILNALATTTHHQNQTLKIPNTSNHIRNDISPHFIQSIKTDISGTVKYMKKGKSLWETHPIEKSRLIYQIGSADPDLALQAAKIVQDDV